ncbi:MAG: T9SS type A sorting domain-containing protein, partial [Oscillospiraceae bacterium]|nr:T9SS type A sorting domain-containing protein [Oscillospiraceae bacterium]
RIIALDNMPGWDKVTVHNSVQKRPFKISNNINLSISGKSLSLSTNQNGRTTVTVFDLTGHRVATLLQGNISAGTHSLSLQSLAAGNYIVKASVGHHNTMQVFRSVSLTARTASRKLSAISETSISFVSGIAVMGFEVMEYGLFLTSPARLRSSERVLSISSSESVGDISPEALPMNFPSSMLFNIFTS